MKLFEYAVVFAPPEPKDGEKQSEKARILVHPNVVLVKDLQTANLFAACMIPDEYKDRLEWVQVAVRPF